MKRNNKKGFTIVELVIVIAIIAILAAVLIPTFANLIKRANVSKDNQLIRNMNTALIADKATSGAHTTMYSALAVAFEAGYSAERINKSSKENEILWDSVNDVFCYYNADSKNPNQIDYVPETQLTTPATDLKAWNYFMIVDVTGNGEVDLSEKYNYSVYLRDVASTVTAVKHNKGVDVGENTVNVNYVHETGDKQNVIIRTNGGTLTVNAPADTVNHFGDADSVNVIDIDSASYHENGKVALIRVASGRIELETAADVAGIHINAKVESIAEDGTVTYSTTTFDNDIILTIGGKEISLTRDSVGDANIGGDSKLLVCKVETANKSEYVWLDGDGTIENSNVYVSSNANGSDAVAVTSSNASDAAKAIANNAVNTGTVSNPQYTAVDTGVTIAQNDDKEIWATYDSQAKLEYLINNTTFTNLKQTANITEMTSVDIPEGRTVVIDMNGYTIDAALQSEGRHYYAFYNYGELTLQDLSEEKTSYIKARGVENLGGKMTINSGTYYNIDANGGAAVWNDSDGIKYMLKADVEAAKAKDQNYYNTDLGISISNGSYTVVDSLEGNYAVAGSDWNGNNNNLVRVYYYKNMDGGDLTINDGNFIVEYVGSASDKSGPGCVISKIGTKLTINGGTFTSSSMRAYTIIADGETVINDCNVTGAHGALAIDSGTATINGGTFTCTEFYGCWITNDGSDTKVTINGGYFKGTYGIYSSVDDGGQDESNIAITINDGKFEGTNGSAVINAKRTQNQFALLIYGGTYNTDPADYVSSSYAISESDGWFVVTK